MCLNPVRFSMWQIYQDHWVLFAFHCARITCVSHWCLCFYVSYSNALQQRPSLCGGGGELSSATGRRGPVESQWYSNTSLLSSPFTQQICQCVVHLYLESTLRHSGGESKPIAVNVNTFRSFQTLILVPDQLWVDKQHSSQHLSIIGTEK